MDTNKVSQYEDDEIDLYALFLMYLEHIRQFIFFFLVGAVILNAYAFFMIHPTYSSASKIYIVGNSNDSIVDLTDLNIGSSLTKDYEDLILSYPVLNEVKDNLKLDYSIKDLKTMLSISNPADTRVLNLKCTSTVPEEARDIANELMKVSITYLPKTMSTAAPNVAETARLPESKDGPSYLKYTAMGAIIGVVLYAAYLTVIYLLDDTVHTSEDMERLFNITPLAVVPDSDIFEQFENEKNKDSRHHRKRTWRDQVRRLFK